MDVKPGTEWVHRHLGRTVFVHQATASIVNPDAGEVVIFEYLDGGYAGQFEASPKARFVEVYRPPVIEADSW